MKNKKGFTLIELLAVIVVLGVIMSIASAAVLKRKKAANIEEAKMIEKEIKQVAEQMYAHEMIVSSGTSVLKNDGTMDYIPISDMVDYDYLKGASVKNPNGKGNCKGYVKFTPSGEFEPHICCENLYQTDDSATPTAAVCNSNYVK